MLQAYYNTVSQSLRCTTSSSPFSVWQLTFCLAAYGDSLAVLKKKVCFRSFARRPAMYCLFIVDCFQLHVCVSMLGLSLHQYDIATPFIDNLMLLLHVFSYRVTFYLNAQIQPSLWKKMMCSLHHDPSQVALQRSSPRSSSTNWSDCWGPQTVQLSKGKIIMRISQIQMKLGQSVSELVSLRQLHIWKDIGANVGSPSSAASSSFLNCLTLSRHLFVWRFFPPCRDSTWSVWKSWPINEK